LTIATVIVCAHNEEGYIEECLGSVVDQTLPPQLVVVVADRCTDNTITIAKRVLEKTRSVIVEKNSTSWRNSISENLQLSLKYAVGDVLVVIDADMTVPPSFLEGVLSELDGYAVVSALVKTDPSKSNLNRLVAIWELTYRFAPLGEQPRGGARAIAMAGLKAVGGFRDVYAWESDLDNRLRKSGFGVKLDRRVTVLHRRKMTLARSVAYQIQAGRARKQLGVSAQRTILHSLVRLRPFVIVGYFRKGTNR
jgi:glycosyltransferase involved in cell wall biosynthesis